MGGDIPIVDVTEGKTTVGVEGAALGYKFNMHELRVSQFLNKPLDTLRAESVRRGWEEFSQRVCFLGSVPHGLPGFLNNAGVTIVAAGGVWSARTVPQILTDVNTVLTGGWTATATVELMDTILLPPAVFGDIATRRTGVELLQTVLEIILKDNIYTTQTGNPLTVKPLSELNTAAVGGGGRLVAYRRDPEVLTFHVPMPLLFHAPQPLGLEVLVPGEGRVSGCEIRYPGACRYMDDVL